MRWTRPKIAVHCLLLACALVAGACSSEDKSTRVDGGTGGAGGTGGRGGTGGATGGSGGGSGGAMGGSGGATGGSGGAGGGPMDAPQFETGGVAGAPKLCGEIRNCVVRCTTPACAQACVDQAPAEARTKYQAVTTCSKAGCAETDTNCRCDRECLEPGPCVSTVDECRDGVEDDTFCDEQCH